MPRELVGTKKAALWLMLGAQLSSALIHRGDHAFAPDLLLTGALLTLLAGWSKLERVRSALLGLVLMLWLVNVSRDALVQSDEALAPALVLLRIFGPLGVLLVGFRFGNVVCVAALGVLVVFIAAHPSADGREAALRSNLFLGICTGHVFVLAYQRTLRALLAGLTHQEEDLAQRVSERARLVEALGDDLTRSIAALERELAQEQPSPAALSVSHEQLGQALARAQATLDPDIAPARPSRGALDELRARMTRWLLWSFAVYIALALVRIVLVGAGPLLSTMGLLLGYLLGLLLLAKRPALYRQVIVSVTFITILAILVAFFYWGLKQPPPNLVYLPGLAYMGLCIGSPLMSLALFAFCLLAIAYVALVGGASTHAHVQLLLDHALVTLVFQAGWHLLERRVRHALAQVERRAHELSDLEVFRTRVCGTLFHDVANPAQVLGMVIDLAQGGTITEADLSRARRLLARLSLLVQAALSVLSGSEPGASAELRGVPLATLLEELEELFAHRLAAKQQTLRVSAGRDLVVLATPELLRDSVLANLVSNAIKFSAPGAAIEIAAQRVEGQIEIAVRDRGPGFSGELIERLQEGVRPTSTTGSAGETGLGLGLTLASEHVRRMGGRLVLRSVPDGGIAAVRLPSP